MRHLRSCSLLSKTLKQRTLTSQAISRCQSQLPHYLINQSKHLTSAGWSTTEIITGTDLAQGPLQDNPENQPLFQNMGLPQLIVSGLPNHEMRYSLKFGKTPSGVLSGLLFTADACPELTTDTLRLYSMKWCPFAQRTRLALAHKQIRHEEVNINLADKPSWLLEKNPEGTVPLLELKSSSQDPPTVQQVIGSTECCIWLESSYPHTPSLISSDAADKSTSDKILHDIGEAGRTVYGYLYDKADSAALTRHLQSIEKLLVPTEYLIGNEVTLSDLMAWPPFERILAKGYIIDSALMPKLSHWVNNMNNLQAVKDVRNSSQGYHKYWASQLRKATEYDIPL